MTRPRIFIGSSSESRPIVDALTTQLTNSSLVIPWYTAFSLSSVTIDQIISELQKADFAIFVVNSDDVVQIRGSEKLQTRDNVLVEIGISIGLLGRERTFLVLSDEERLRLPSDLLGVTHGVVRAHDLQLNADAAVTPFAAQVRTIIRTMTSFDYSDRTPHGSNILAANFVSASANIAYALAAKTRLSQGLKVRLDAQFENMTSDANWMYSVGDVRGWYVTSARVPRFQQEFHLSPGDFGDMKITFGGNGSARLSYFEAGSISPTREKNLSWQNS